VSFCPCLHHFPTSVKKIAFGFAISFAIILYAPMALIISVHERLEKPKYIAAGALTSTFPNFARLMKLPLLLGRCCKGGAMVFSMNCVRMPVDLFYALY
jgi:hypothetical protein